MEKEKRLSRPASGQFAFNNQRLTAVNGSSRDSIGTTDSTNSEEDNTPPPLPVKLREADYCNLPDDSPVSPSPPTTTPHTPVRPKPPPPEPTDRVLPPTPPPKRPHIKPPLSMPLV
ncbi:sulfated surface glycoprotein 185-like [Homalodisca vitripennis]|nr:sulfated surface glycoprotein 185-like [Homalodisca vitripennis]